jgi:Uma2 family endonuclease
MTMTILFTRTDYEALPEGIPVELHDGLLVKQPSPRYGHQRIQTRILIALSKVIEPDCFAPGPVDVLIDELNVFVPDIVVHGTPPDDEAQYMGVPAAVFEVLSPSTKRRDREFKARRYLGLGVKEVWLIDRHEKTIEIVDLEGGHLTEGNETAKSAVITDFQLVPTDLFSAP